MLNLIAVAIEKYLMHKKLVANIPLQNKIKQTFTYIRAVTASPLLRLTLIQISNFFFRAIKNARRKI